MSDKIVAAQMMRDLEKKYGKTFLEKSLHSARFDYAALRRIVSGADTDCPPVSSEARHD